MLNPAYDVAGLDLCTSLAQSAVTAPVPSAWNHNGEVIPGDGCGGPTGYVLVDHRGPDLPARQQPVSRRRMTGRFS